MLDDSLSLRAVEKHYRWDGLPRGTEDRSSTAAAAPAAVFIAFGSLIVYRNRERRE